MNEVTVITGGEQYRYTVPSLAMWRQMCGYGVMWWSHISLGWVWDTDQR